jgi:multidrug resistance efflux pump
MRCISVTQKLCAEMLFLCFGLLIVGAVQAAEEADSASDKEPAKPKEMKIVGVVEAVNTAEISADTEHIESFKIKRFVPHGKQVSQGQNVIWFESKDINKKVKETQIEQRLSKLKLQDAEFSYKQFLETQNLDRAAAKRSRKNARQDYDNFVQIDRDRQMLTAEFNLKFSRAALENAMEELEQLEQMYKEDDLTEQSEEIVLKRAKRAVESAQFRLDGTEIQSERKVKQGIPRSAAEQAESLARAQLAYKKSMQELESARRQRDIELNRQRDKFKELEEDFAELRQERKRVVLTSPIDGIVLHGKLNRGKLSEKPSPLKVGSKVTANQVVATVVDPRKLRIRVDLEEKYLATVIKGAKCKVKLKAFPEFETVGKVKSVSTVPYAGTKYDCVVTFRQTKQQPTLLPIMTCELEFESAEPETEQQETDEQETDDKETDEKETEEKETDEPAAEQEEQE